ncbi:hypothetical protein LT85_0302 [Collimonas arenae]|uniref:Uncharacterized protein n=2 Tax=Collimonas arenae TaxID=279058 RepID=A0A0A1F9C2_9BURK|nr:hypothetical protein LT85_0302 [Collimonas arenae]
MLFMQLAVAGYVCPEHAVEQISEMAGMSVMADSQAMPGCEQIDHAQPSLCKVHTQAGQQSLDKPNLPHVQPFVPATLVLLSVIAVVDYPIALLPESTWLQRATAPPLSIQHCCFRI